MNTLQHIVVSAPKAERRRHPRAPLNLPVRLRWLGPFGQFVEIAETLDVGRGGLLVGLSPGRHEPGALRTRLWVTLPFDPNSALPQPEVPSRLVRLKKTPAGGLLLAVEFEPSDGRPRPALLSLDRRRRERVRLALPICVRLPDSPWPDETMSVDVSENGVLFCTARLYSVGVSLLITFPPGTFPSRRAVAGDAFSARVVRVARQPDYDFVAVSFSPLSSSSPVP